MKKAFSKSLSWLLSVVMIFGIFVVGDLTEVNATGSITTQDIQRVLDKYGYTTGSYWTMWDYPNYGGSDCGATVQTINSELYASSNPATSSSSNVQSWKSYNFNNSWQCHGFALYVMSKVTGNTVSSAGGTNWTKITSKPSYLQIGDIIRTSQHTAVVLTADNGRYTFAECWGSSKNKISIGKGFNYYYYTLDSITSNDTFQYVLRYNGGIHIHSYEYVYYLKDHPHCKCYRCSCGDVTVHWDESTPLDTCEACLSDYKATLNLDKSSYEVGNPVTISWNKVDNATHYNLWIYKITDGNEPALVSRDDMIKDTTFTYYNLPVGKYYT